MTRYLSLLLPLWACFNLPPKAVEERAALPYNLKKPVARFQLPSYLNEISGLSNVSGKLYLACLQDEKGQIFYIDKQTGAVTEGALFKTDGDFEGIEVVDGVAWCIRSKGKLSRVLANTPTETLELPFNTAVDIEGLGYDGQLKALLIADKGAVKQQDSRQIWAYSLQNKQLRPLFQLQKKDFYAFLTQKKSNHAKDYAPETPIFDFGPSSIATDPKSGHYYILSSVNKLLVVVDKKGQLQEIVKLDKQQHPQPEGLCFDEKNRLYISDEAKNGETAHIEVYDRQN